MGSRAWPPLLVLAFWLIFAILRLGAAPSSPVRLDMFLGYDGTVPMGSWFPASFEVQNDGPGFQGEIEVTSSQFGGGPRRGIALELPSGTTKRFVLPLFNSGQWGSWNAVLRDDRGRVRAESKGPSIRRWQDANIPLAGALSRVLPELPSLPGPQGDRAPAFARLQPATFPDHPITLEGLDTVYLASEKALELRPAQAAALVAWVQAGGHLVVGVEQPGHLSGSGDWLRRLLPADVTGLAQSRSGRLLREWVDGAVRRDGTSWPRPPLLAPGVASEPLAGGTLQVARLALRDGRVLVGTPEEPLLVIGRRGHGQITLLAFAPELEPFRGWPGAPYFWARLLDFSPGLMEAKGNTSGYASRNLDGVMGAMVDSEQVRKLPVGWLLLLLVAYLAVIGPVDHYCLRRLRRQMLTWITFPIYVAFFSVLIYFIGYKLRAGETEWNELQVVDLLPRGAQADWRGWTFASVYSPANARYRVASAQPVATLRSDTAGGPGPAQEAAQTRIRMVNQGCEGVLSVPIWTSQLFVSDWRREAPAPLGLVVAGDRVTVTNGLPVRLAQARVCHGEDVYELGPVGPGQSLSFSLASQPRRSLRSFVELHGSGFRTAVDTRNRAFGDPDAGRLRDVTNAVMAASFATLLRETDEPWQRFRGPPGFDLRRLLARGDAVLLAFVPGHSPVPSLNQFPARRRHQHTLYRLAVPVRSTP